MIYIVTDRNNADRAEFIVDAFQTRAEAQDFVAQLSADNDGELFAIEEFETLADARGDGFTSIETAQAICERVARGDSEASIVAEYVEQGYDEAHIREIVESAEAEFANANAE